MHAERGLERLDACREIRIRLAFRQVLPVEVFGQLQFSLLNPFRFRSPLHVGNRLRAWHDTRALMEHRQEIRAEYLLARIRKLGRDHHERRQVLVEGSESIADPRAHAGPIECRRARVDADGRTEVVAIDVLHRAYDADVVNHAACLREQIGHFNAALAVALVLPVRAFVEVLIAAACGLAVIGGQVWLRVEAIDMRDSTGHEEEDDALGFGREVRSLGCERILGVHGSAFEHVGEEAGQ